MHTAPAPASDQRLAWFRAAKFGMFVHFGCYSGYQRGEQIMFRDAMPLDEYRELAERFDPEPGWAEALCAAAVEAGCTYIVLTTRHHDGYCLFDTATHDFNAVQTGPGRDLVAEYVAAARAAGLKIGFYYSVHTWRWPGFWDPAGHPEDLPAMVDELHAQVEELMTGYGQVDLLWYDVCSPPGHRVPGHAGRRDLPEAIDQTPAEFWRSAEINARVRELQPQILINNRSGLPEDFGTPEQHITAEADGRAWEACMTLNYAPGWGYLPGAVANKSHGEVLWHLVDAVRQGGNFLFNVGPDGRGRIDAREGEALRAVGAWLQRNGEAIFGTSPGRIYECDPGQGPNFHYGMFTCKGRTAYLTLFYYPGTELVISRLQPGITGARILGDERELTVEAISNRRWRIGGLPATSPDPLATVVAIDFEAEPYPEGLVGAAWLRGEW